MKTRTLLGLLLFFGSASLFGQVATADSLALVDLYNNLDGPNWTNHDQWLEGPVSDWFGITVKDNRVEQLNLSNNNLKGSLPTSIGDLTELQRLALQVNEITGAIPETIANCQALEVCWLYRNSLSGPFPEVLTTLAGLTQLDISANDFEGPVPAAIGNLVNLRTLSLERNRFSGPLPDLSALQLLSSLFLRENELEGSVAESLGNHPDLYYVLLNDNHFTGSLSDTLFNPSRLQYLHFQNNEIDSMGDFSAFPSLSRLYCWGNKLSFEDLEPNAGVSNLTYAPMDSLLEVEAHIVAPGETVTMQSGSLGTHTVYQWYKDGEAISEATGSTLEVSSFSDSDAGVYTCEMKNSMLPDLTLYRSAVTLQSTTSTNAYDWESKVYQVFPRPAGDRLFIEGIEHRERIEVFDMSGVLRLRAEGQVSLDISTLSPGMYMLLIDRKAGFKVIKR